jgi:predicted transposase YbfD/YdcC
LPKKTAKVFKGIYRVKANNLLLLKNLKELVKYTKPIEKITEIDKLKHGRCETREAAIYFPRRSLILGVIHDPEWYKIVKKVVHIRKTVKTTKYIKGVAIPKTTITNEYLIVNSVLLKPLEIVKMIRKHWRIKVSHHMRDTLFREDHSRIRNNPGAFARMRSLTLNILNSQNVSSITKQVQKNRHSEVVNLLGLYRELW